MQAKASRWLIAIALALSLLGCRDDSADGEEGRAVDALGRRVLGHTDLGAVRIFHVAGARYDLEILKRISPHDRELLETYLKPLHQWNESPELTHALLLQAANGAGHRGSEKPAWEMLEPLGLTPDQPVPVNLRAGPVEIRRWVDDQGWTLRAEYAARDPLQAAKGYLAIRDFLESKWKSNPDPGTLEDFYRGMSMAVKVAVLRIPWDRYIDQTAQPSEDQIRDTFEQYRNVPAGQVDPKTNPFGLGYRVPLRVELQTVEVNRKELLEQAPAISPEEVVLWYNENRQEYVDPATGEPRPVIEVARQIEQRLKLEWSQQHLRRFEDEIGLAFLNAHASDADLVISQVARDLLPEGSFRVRKTGLVPVAELAQQPPWSEVRWSRSVGELPLGQRFEEELSDSDTFGFWQENVELVKGLDSPQGQVDVIWRVARLDQPHAPKELTSSLAEKIAYDLRIIEAGKIALGKAADLASREDLEEIASRMPSSALEEKQYQPGLVTWTAQNRAPGPTPVGFRPPPEEHSPVVLLARELLELLDMAEGASRGGVAVVSVASGREVWAVCIEEVVAPEKVSQQRMLDHWHVMHRLAVMYRWLREDSVQEQIGFRFEEASSQDR